MYKKIILSIVLVAFASVHLANGLECFHCVNPTACETATIVTCTNETAAATGVALGTALLNVPNMHSLTFNCLHIAYGNTQNPEQINLVVEVAGCVAETSVCNLQLNNAHAGLNQTVCTECSGNRCNNPRNPAGTFSSSTFTIVGSALMLMIAKFFA